MKKIKIHFVSKAGPKLASFRMRIQTPVQLLNSSLDVVEATYGIDPVPEATINVFSKHFEKAKHLIAMDAKDDLGYIGVFDVCDDHFDREDGPYYETMIKRADAVTCNSKNMQERIYEVTGVMARIIPDPISFPNTSFKQYSEGDTPKVLWYGHSSNMRSLAFVAKTSPVVVTAYCDKLYKGIPNVSVKKWGLGVVEGVIKDYDIVLLPTQEHPWAKCKSPNRAVDALVAGKYVITDSPEIYEDLKDFVRINPNLAKPGELQKELEFWKNNPDVVKKMVEGGQKYVEKMCTSDKILDQWLEVLKDVGLIKRYENCA
jgi:hypothetical protein